MKRKVSSVFFLLLVLTVFVACNSNMEAFQQWSTTEDAALMEKELPMLGQHTQVLEFHKMMLMECTDQKQQPYPQLNALLDSMTVLRSQVQSRRMELKKERSILWDEGKASKKKLDEEKAKAEIAQQQTSRDTAAFQRHYADYQSLVNENGIVFISHATYADSLLERLIQWEDSLEYQGGSIAQSKRRLDGVGMPKTSGLYIDYYQPISQMQLLHKEFQGMLVGLENAHSRYLTARPDEGFFYGPFLVDRPDVITTEGIFDRLDSTMKRFRIEEQNAWLKIRR